VKLDFEIDSLSWSSMMFVKCGEFGNKFRCLAVLNVTDSLKIC